MLKNSTKHVIYKTYRPSVLAHSNIHVSACAVKIWGKSIKFSVPVMPNKTKIRVYSVCSGIYCISSVIRWRFFSFQNNPKNLDPSYKTDLHVELWDMFRKGQNRTRAKFHRTESSARQRIHMKNQALFSSRGKSKKSKCCLLQYLFGTLRIKVFLGQSRLQPLNYLLTLVIWLLLLHLLQYCTHLVSLL